MQRQLARFSTCLNKLQWENQFQVLPNIHMREVLLQHQFRVFSLSEDVTLPPLAVTFSPHAMSSAGSGIGAPQGVNFGPSLCSEDSWIPECSGRGLEVGCCTDGQPPGPPEPQSSPFSLLLGSDIPGNSGLVCRVLTGDLNLGVPLLHSSTKDGRRCNLSEGRSSRCEIGNALLHDKC